MYTVAVLMSTYNGEAFIRSQIESILKQQGVVVRLYIRDDGSSDGTKEILKHYEASNDCVRVSLGRNMGPALSFMNLLYENESNVHYYAFADQDDIWLPNKLNDAIKLLNSIPGKSLYASNQAIINSHGELKGVRYSSHPPIDLINIIDKNFLSGCTMVMTQELFKLAKSTHPSNGLLTSRMHDTWIASLSALTGGIVYDERTYIQYRQHSNNVVGTKEAGSTVKMTSKIKSRGSNYHKKYADELLQCISKMSQVSSLSMHVLRLYSNTNTLRGKFDFLKSECFRKYYKRNKLQFAIKLLLLE